MFVGRERAEFMMRLPNGNIVVKRDGENYVRTFDRRGKPADFSHTDLTNELPITVQVVTLYPNGGVYQKEEPVRSSMYGLDQLIQVRITRQGARVISKELLD